MLRVKRAAVGLAWTLAVAVFGCASTPPRAQLPLSSAGERTTLAPGDVFQLKIVGEKELPEEYQVASDGTVDLPYIHTLKVTGLEPQEVARLIRERLIEEKVLSDPAVVVSVKEYVSKRITLLGEVQKPGSFPVSPGLTLIQALSLAGGLTSIANKEQVRLTRVAKDGTTNTVVLDIGAITEGDAPDIPLQPGDRIYVKERIF
ncbi:MAG TPA: polysaccharide biosynthesis/export family protein [Polyangiaceae bacterium]|nr:polysaccharide biosynthesis/export family protein [Polyangiaceae bacterium]